jgi:hypothetical protein
MQIKRFVASSLAALMAGATFAGAALAATSVGGVLKTLGSQAAAGTPYLVVVGDTAAASDVVGAIDVASALAQQVTKEVAVPGVTAFDVEGKARGDVIFDTDTDITGYLGSVLTKTQVPQLFRGEITYGTDKFTVAEEITLPNAKIGFDKDILNGTVYLDLTAGGALKYTYRFITPFNKALSVNNPLSISLFGQEFKIVNYTASTFKALTGVTGTATDTTPVVFGDYKVYSDLGSDTWARIIIKDKNDNTVDTLIIDKGETKDSTLAGLTITVTKVRALSDGRVVGVELIVGPIGKVEKEYKVGEDYFPGTDLWKLTGVVVEGGALKAIEYTYQLPNATYQYLKLGDKIVAPNGYFELGFPDLSVKKFVTLTIHPTTVSIYETPTSTSPLTGFSGVSGIAFEADSPVFKNLETDKAVVAKNSTHVILAYWDSSVSKYVYNNHSTDLSTALSFEGKYDMHPFTVTIQGDNVNITGVKLTDGGDNHITAAFNLSAVVPTAQLGVSKNTAEDSDVSVSWEGAPGTVGTWEFDAVSPYGTVVSSVKSNAATDKVVIKLPADRQKAYVYVGRLKATTTADGTYKTYAPLSLPVAKLASEVTPADKANANIVLVGGPCANSLVQALVDAGKLDASFTCAGGTPGPAWTPGAAYVKVVEDAFATGRVALVVAGTNAADTRLATSLLSQGKLADQKASGVKVSGTVTAPVVTPM